MSGGAFDYLQQKTRALASTIDEMALEDRPVWGDIAGCGSGRLIVYQAQSSPDAFFVVVAVDETCVKLTASNGALANDDAHIRYGDALTTETHQAFTVYHDPDRGGCITID